jgi:hemerythrin
MEDNVVLDWDDVYTIGHDKVDGEHQRLFELAKEVTNCKDDKIEIMQSIKELIKYTKFHFTNEEQYMKSINFLFLEEHKLLHKNIVSKINNLVQNINILTSNQIKTKLATLINKNIIKHILTEDKRVHHYRRDKNELKSIFSWKEKYQIAHYTIDTEHKKLFDIAMRALQYNVTGINIKKHIRDTINELYDYMRIHFEHEEEYMQSINYEGYEEHKDIHENIIEQLNTFIKQIPTLSTEKFERLLIEYMDVWLINHIIIEDRKIIASIEGLGGLTPN